MNFFEQQTRARAATRRMIVMFALAVSAVNGCGTCVQAHEKVVIDGGLTTAHVNDAIRIAAVVMGAAVGLELGT